jgi:hypothetical protein
VEEEVVEDGWDEGDIFGGWVCGVWDCDSYRWVGKVEFEVREVQFVRLILILGLISMKEVIEACICVD